MAPAPLPQELLRFDALSAHGPTEVLLEPAAPAREAFARALDISAVKKLRLVGTLTPVGKGDWTLSATLGATVVQPCVVTLDPVSTRIDETLTRHYLADWEEPEGDEVEMPEDDSAEPLPAEIDLVQVCLEALALALPTFPRAAGAELGDANFTAPGVAPLTDGDAKPFAGLAALRETLKKDGSEG